jgi:putative glutamine amidotransferase
MPTPVRPVLAVVDVSDFGRDDPAFHDELVALTDRLLAVAREVGFDPVRLPAEQLGERGLLDATRDVDAVVLMGGEDVDPMHYDGPAVYPGAGRWFAVADTAQLALVRHAVDVGLPTLGICRGMQVINVALGGDLVQHLEGDVHVAAGTPESSMVDHPVSLDAGSTLAGVLGATSLTVRSSHHQAVGRLGAGLVGVGTAPDGTVEAVEHRSAPLLAVQWHPEDVGAVGSVLADLLEALRERALARG